MITFIRPLTCFVLLIIALISVPFTASADDSVKLVKAIRFQPGTITTTISGQISSDDLHWYHVQARAGQEMKVVLKTDNKTSFTIFGQQSGILEGADDVRETLVKLPETGDYLIEIGTEETAKYTLQVSIK